MNDNKNSVPRWSAAFIGAVSSIALAAGLAAVPQRASAIARSGLDTVAEHGVADAASDRFVVDGNGLTAPSHAVSPLEPLAVSVRPELAQALCHGEATIAGGAGPVAATMRCDARSGLLVLTPAHDLMPGGQYVLFVKARGEKTASRSVSFSTMSLPAESTANAAWAPAEWTPPTQPSLDGWRYANGNAATVIADLGAPRGQTAVAGHLARFDGSPLAGVEVAIETHHARTDAQGRFIIAGIEPGSNILKVDGTQVQADGGHFTKHFVHVEAHAGETTRLPEPIYLAKVDPASEVAIASPTDREIVLTHPAMPGLEVRIPKGVVLREFDGAIVRKVSLTPVPIDRAPYAVPTSFSIYFTLQPGGAFVDSTSAESVSIVYPNYQGFMAKAAIDLWNYDPQSGWKVYGHGHISDDAKTVVADGGFQLKQIMTFGYGVSGTPPSAKSPVPGGSRSGDPIDLATGIFVYHRSDLSIADVMPIGIDRRYQQTDTDAHSFGVGSNLSYNLSLYQPNTGEIDLVQADGTRVPMLLQSTDVFVSFTVPGSWFGATLTKYTNPNYSHQLQFKLTMRDKSWMIFDGDAPNPLLEIHDRNGNFVKISHDGGHISRVTSPSGRYIDFTYTGNFITQATDNSGRTVTYCYDAAGTRVASVLDADQALLPLAQQMRTKYAYDANGRMWTVTNKRGNVILTNLYYADGRIQKQTLADNTNWQYTYSPNLWPGTTYAQATYVTNPRGFIDAHSFDSHGYETLTIFATNAKAPYAPRTYTITRDDASATSSNHVVTMLDPLLRQTEYQYDAYGNVKTVTKTQNQTTLSTVSMISDPLTAQLESYTNEVKATTQITLDNAGNAIGVTDALNRLTQIDRNGYGLTEQITDPLGHALTVGYSGADSTSFSDPYGRTTSMTRDALGRIDSTTDALGNATTVRFDARDNVVGTVDPLNHATTIGRNPDSTLDSVLLPGHTQTQSFGYDARGRVNSSTDPLGRGWNALLDGSGNVTQLTDENKKITKAKYDSFGRLDTITFSDTSTLKYTFDDASRLTKLVDSVGGTISIVPNALDHITSVTTRVGKVGYVPDALGRIGQITYPSGLVVKYVFDKADELKTVTVGSDQPFTATYEGNGRLKTLTLPNGAVRTQLYKTPGDDLASINYADANGQAIGGWSYVYDGAGRIQSSSGSFLAPVMPAPFAATYDGADQLATNAGTTVHYDPAGMQNDDLSLSLSYDARGRMTGAARAGSPSAIYGYDAIGQRDIKTLSDGTVTHFVYDLFGHLLAETDGAGNTQLEYVWFGSKPVMLRVHTGASVAEYMIYSDAQNTPRRMTDSSNAMRWIWDSDPHGNGAPNTNPGGLGAVDLHLRFAGQIADAETGLYHNGVRDYNPKTGRYVQKDPVGLLGGTNVYVYAADRPVIATDSSGLSPEMCAAGLPAWCAPPPAPPLPPVDDPCVIHFLNETYGDFGGFVATMGNLQQLLPSNNSSTSEWGSTFGEAAEVGAVKMGGPKAVTAAGNWIVQAAVDNIVMAAVGAGYATVGAVAGATVEVVGAAVTPFGTTAMAIARSHCACDQ